MKRLRSALRWLIRWRIAIPAALVLIIVYGVYTLLGDSDQAGLEENQRVVPVRMDTLVREVTIDGSIVFSSKEILTFASQGFVEEILVSEGEEVKAGQPLARLDPESIARLQQAVAQARLDLLDQQDAVANALNPTLLLAEAEKAVSDAKLAVRDAQGELDSLLSPDAHDVARAEKAVSDAKSALQDAWAEFDALLDPPAHAVAEAEKAVTDARAALQDAQDALAGGFAGVQADVNAAMRDLDAARRNLQDARNTDGHAEQRKTLDEKSRAYAAAVSKWTGVDLTPDELTLTPDALFDEWGFEPGVVYGKGYELFPDGRLRDNPATRWSELTVYAWTVQHPSGDFIRVTCEESGGAQAGASGRGREELCIRGDIDDSWAALDVARRELEGLLVQQEGAIARAEAGVIRSEKALAEARKILAGLEGGPRAELPRKRLALAKSNLERAIVNLAKLTAPDPVDVEGKRGQALFAQSNLSKAEADLAKLTAPDPVEVENKRSQAALARANLAAAEKAAAELTARRDLEVTLKRAVVVSAQAKVDGAVSRLDDSTLEAPSDGYVSRILVEEREEVDAAKTILEVIDFGVVEVRGKVDEIDVLSLERGASAVITLDALPDQTLEGVIANISSDASNERGVVTFDVDVKVTIPDGVRLQEGLSAAAKVALGQEQGLLIPNQAIHGDYNNPTVFVVNGDDVEERAVTIGSSDGFWSVALSGLSENEQIVFEVSPPDAREFRGSVTVRDEEYEEAEPVVVEDP